MNKNSLGDSPKTKTKTSPPIKLLTSNMSKKQSTPPILNNGNSSLQNPIQFNKSNSKTSFSSDKNIRLPNLSIDNSAPNSASKNTHLNSIPRSTDNIPVDATVTSQLSHNNDSQSLIEHSIKPSSIQTNNNMNFAMATATENTPSREQAIVFNSIDGIPQVEYIIAIGKIVKPTNIIFVSRISNHRFCIFLSSKEVLDNLMLQTQYIKINDQLIYIRRLVNQAKRIVISNVCPSIPNWAILDTLKHININPTSHINHLKAGIKMEGYEHIMSFRRQMYINYEDFPKLPSSMLITLNENQFRVFFTDDTLTCFLCKAVGHTSNNCNKNSETKAPSELISNSNAINTIETQPAFTKSDPHPPLATLRLEKNQEQTTLDLSSEIAPDTPPFISVHNEETPSTLIPNDSCKRPISDSSSIKPPDSPNFSISPNITKKKEKTLKKAKIRSRSNSSHRADNTTSEEHKKPIEKFFTSSDNIPITYIQFIYILENFTNKSLNIHSITEDVNIAITPLMDIIDQIRPLVNDRSLKSRLTKLSNLLFQAQPVQSS